ncbi:MAG: PQQ-dependent sugar dehydrogenase [Gammaproteobacteria bacterium]
MIQSLRPRRLPFLAGFLSLFATCASSEELAVPAEPTFWVEEVASGLKNPFSLTWLPGGDALITERNGGLRRLHEGKLAPQAISGVPPNHQGILNGLIDVVLDPAYAANSRIYLALSEGTAAAHHAALYSATLTGSALTDTRRIFRSTPDIGGISPITGRLLRLPDGTLILSVMGGQPQRDLAQRLDNHIAKLVRINRDGTVPRDNPFLATPGALPEIFAIGLRSTEGLFFDASTSRIWSVDIGPKGGDELNLIKPGANYGWPTTTWGFDYSGAPVSGAQSSAGVEDPLNVWTPAVSPASITRLRSDEFPGWRGDFFIGMLTSKELRRLRINDRFQVTLQETLLADLDERIRFVTVGPDNYLYVLTDHPNGRLLRLRPGQPAPHDIERKARPLALSYAPADTAEPGFALMPSNARANPANGRQIFNQRCAACHRMGHDVEGGEIGPDLAGVFGRSVGRAPGFNYSSAMSAAPYRWEERSLDLFLSDPKSFIPGNTMAAASVSDARDRLDLIAFIKKTSP